MDKFKSLLFGATMAAATVTAVSFAPTAAMAISIGSSLTVTGVADVGPLSSPNTTAIDWTTNQGFVSEASGTFSQFNPNPLPNKSVTLKDLPLTIVAGSLLTHSNGSSEASYTFSSITTFMDFGLVDLYGQGSSSLTFDLDAGTLKREVTIDPNAPTGNSVVTFSPINTPITGKFIYNGQWIASGELTGQRIFNLDSNGNLVAVSGTTSISVTTAVPEPLTMGGLAIGAGFGAYLKKRYSKKEKELAKV